MCPPSLKEGLPLAQLELRAQLGQRQSTCPNSELARLEYPPVIFVLHLKLLALKPKRDGFRCSGVERHMLKSGGERRGLNRSDVLTEVELRSPDSQEDKFGAIEPL